MKLFKRFILALAAVAAIAGMAMAEETIKVGVYLPLTGGNAIGG